MKKVCVRVLFFIFSFINLSFADVGTYGGAIVRVNCIPELSTIELIQNDLSNAIMYYEWGENKLNHAKQQNYFLTDNDNRDDRFFETKCIIDNDIYTIKLKSGYKYAETVVSADILKNNTPIFSNLFLTTKKPLYSDSTHLFNFSYNTATQEINSIIEYPYYTEKPDYSGYINKQKWGVLDIKELNKNNEQLNKPENWQELDLHKKQIALYVKCNPLLEIAEVRTIPHNKQNFTTKEITNLNQKGIYPLFNSKLPQEITQKCSFDSNNYTLNIDKDTKLTLSQNNNLTVENVNFSPQNDTIIYFLYQTEERIKVFSYKNNKFAMCRNKEIKNLHSCLNKDSYYDIRY